LGFVNYLELSDRYDLYKLSLIGNVTNVLYLLNLNLSGKVFIIYYFLRLFSITYC